MARRKRKDSRQGPPRTTRSGVQAPESRKRAASRAVRLTAWLQNAAAVPVMSPVQWWLLWGGAGMVCLAGFAALLGGFSTGAVFPPPSGADFARVHLVFRDLFLTDAYPASGWRLSVAPYYVPDFALTWLMTTVLPPFVATYAFIFVQGLLGAAGWIAVCRKSGGGAVAQSALLAAIGVQWILLTHGTDLFYITGSILAHGGAWAMMPWLLYVSLFARNGFSPARAVALGVLLALIAASDMLIVPWFVAPMTAVVSWMVWRRRASLRDGLRFAAAMAGGIAGGRLLHQLMPFVESPNTGTFINLKPDRMSATAQWLLDYMSAQAAAHWWTGPAWAAFAVITLATAACCVFGTEEEEPESRGKRRADDERRNAVLAVTLFVPLAVVSSLAAFIAAGTMLQEYELPGWEPRYFLPALFLPFFTAWMLPPLSRFIAEHAPRPATFILPVLALPLALSTSPAWTKIDATMLLPEKSPAGVCAREAALRLNWRGGIATFGMLSDMLVDENNPVERSLIVENFRRLGGRYADFPLLSVWDASNRHWYAGEFQFVAVGDHRGRVWRQAHRRASDLCEYRESPRECYGSLFVRTIDERTARDVFGEPQEIVECEGVLFYHYDPPIRVVGERPPEHIVPLQFSR